MKLCMLFLALAMLLVSCRGSGNAVDTARKADPDTMVFPAIHTITDSAAAGQVEAQVASYQAALGELRSKLLELEEQAAIAARKGWLWLISLFVLLGAVGGVVAWWVTKSRGWLTLAGGLGLGAVLLMAIANWYEELLWVGLAGGGALVIVSTIAGARYLRRESAKAEAAVKYGQDLEKHVVPGTIETVRDEHRRNHVRTGLYSDMKKLVNTVRGET